MRQILIILFFIFHVAAGSQLASAAESVTAPIEAIPDSQIPAEDESVSVSTVHREINDIPTRPVENELSPAALETYAYLLLIQAILDEDEAALLDAAQLMEKSDSSANIWLDGGVWLMSRKSPNSVPYLELALKRWPEDLSLNLLYAEALGDHGMAERGVNVMEDYLKRHPDTLDARLELALLLVKSKEFGKAQNLLAQITQKQRTPLVDYYQARALLGMDKRQQAIPFLRKAIKAMPAFAEALAELAFVYEQEGNLREARATYEKLQKLQFSPQEVALRLIDLSLRLKQPEKALQYIKQGPDSVPFKLGAANMLRESGHFLQAESLLKQMAARKDAPADVYLILADLVFELRRNLEASLSWLDKVPADSPSAPIAGRLRLQLMAESGKINEALDLADKYASQYPELPEFKELQIRLLARDKKMDLALETARQAIGKWPDNLDLNFLYGSLLDENGKKKEAMEVMENLIKKDPEHFQALNYVGYTLAEENRNLPRALELLVKANELSPNQSYIIDSLAWALFRSGQGAEALKEIRRAVNIGDNIDASIWEHYGDIASSQKKRDEARKAYQRAIDLKPDNIKDLKRKLSNI